MKFTPKQIFRGATGKGETTRLKNDYPMADGSQDSFRHQLVRLPYI